MAKLVILEQAREDIFAIAQYTESQWGASQREKYISELALKIKLLATQPALDRSRKEVGENIRSFVYEKHIIFYTYDKDVVKIFNIIDQRMDASRHIILPDGDNLH